MGQSRSMSDHSAHTARHDHHDQRADIQSDEVRGVLDVLGTHTVWLWVLTVWTVLLALLVLVWPLVVRWP